MSSISKIKDYTLRVPLYGEGEMEILTKGFNDMLEQIQVRDTELKKRTRERRQARRCWSPAKSV